MPLGIVLRRSPGVTRWSNFVWRATDVLPGARADDWRILTEDGEVVQFHAATRDLTLYVSDTEAYVHELQAKPPSVYIILREDTSEHRLHVLMATVSPYEAQDYADSAEEIVEKVPMPPAVLAWVQNYVAAHHVEEEFIKRKRGKYATEPRENGVGDSRVPKLSDVYSVPRRAEREAAE
ncbi:MAG: DUF3305 domain-containing protein [Pseudomonadota bacterium]